MIISTWRCRHRVLVFTFFLLSVDVAPSIQAAPAKDYSGLFGSYKREKYVENDARNTDIGVDLGMSTFLPLSSLAQSIENKSNGQLGSLASSSFFNLEASFFTTLYYNYELFLKVAWCQYETRKENSVYTNAGNNPPIYHQFEMEMFPFLAGVKYRFSRGDIVPYVGLGLGVASVRRKGFYDYDAPTNVSDEETRVVFASEVLAGAEFFITSQLGIRFETSGFFLYLPEKRFDPVASNNYPTLVYQSNPFLLKYASHLFFLF